MTRSLQFLTANLTGTTRRATINGREFLIAPAAMIVPGILNGSKGALLYPDDEVARDPAIWNGIPLSVYHPIWNGQHVSVNHPGWGDRNKVGFIEGSTYNGKLRAEAYFDVEKVRNYDRDLPDQHKMLPRLERGQPIELSTGLFTDNEPNTTGALHKGRQYSYVARNYRPDHLAVLPDQVGACSINDGCDIMVNAAPDLDAMVEDALALIRELCDDEDEDVPDFEEADLRANIEKELSNTANCGGPGSGVPGPCPGGGTATSSQEAPRAGGLKGFAQKVVTKIAEKIQAKYEGMKERYGKAGAIAVMAGIVATLPVPLPGTTLVPIGIAEGVRALRRAFSTPTKNEANSRTVNDANFASEAQRKYMWSQEPDIAEAWAHGEHSQDENPHKMPEGTGKDVKGPQAKQARKDQKKGKAMTKNQLVSWLNIGEDLGLDPTLLANIGQQILNQPRHPKDGTFQGKTATHVRKGFESPSEELHEDDAPAELVGEPNAKGDDGRQNVTVTPKADDDYRGATDDHENPKNSPEELAKKGKELGIKPTGNTMPLPQPGPEQLASRQAVSASLGTDHGDAHDHALGAMGAVRSEDTAGASGFHEKAAKAHEKKATELRKAGDAFGADQHDQAGALHRKAKSMHDAVMNRKNNTTSNQGTAMKKITTRTQAIAVLTANCSCEKTRQVYNGLPDGDVIKLANAKAEGSNADAQGGGTVQAGGEEDEDSDEGKGLTMTPQKAKSTPATNVTFELLLANASPDDREAFEIVRRERTNLRAKYITQLTANAQGDQKKALEAMYSKTPLEALRLMADSMPRFQPPHSRLDRQTDPAGGPLYIGNAGVNPTPNPTGNGSQDNELVLDILTMNDLNAEERSAKAS